MPNDVAALRLKDRSEISFCDGTAAVSTPMAQNFPGQNHSIERFPLKGLLKVWILK